MLKIVKLNRQSIGWFTQFFRFICNINSNHKDSLFYEKVLFIDFSNGIICFSNISAFLEFDASALLDYSYRRG